MDQEWVIRQGSRLDLPAVLQLQGEHQLNSWMDANGRHGFLVSGYSAPELEDLLDSRGLLLVATSQAGVPVGFLIASSGESYLRRHPKTQVVWSHDARTGVLAARFSSGDFRYLDQMAVARASFGTGLGTELLRRAISLDPGNLCFGAVISKPVRNERSHIVFRKAGLVEVGSLITPKYRGFDSLESTLFASTEGIQ
jgi:hypothetical protein